MYPLDNFLLKCLWQTYPILLESLSFMCFSPNNVILYVKCFINVSIALYILIQCDDLFLLLVFLVSLSTVSLNEVSHLSFVLRPCPIVLVFSSGQMANLLLHSVGPVEW